MLRCGRTLVSGIRWRRTALTFCRSCLDLCPVRQVVHALVLLRRRGQEPVCAVVLQPCRVTICRTGMRARDGIALVDCTRSGCLPLREDHGLVPS